jgi:catechol 2,3-dioxygenase-like lactoylglutathione lyase family enzyme
MNMTHPSGKLNVSDVKVFVPALNYDQSLKFYTLLGWQLRWQSDNRELAELELADCRFYLQNYYVKDWANNFMFHVTVTDAQAWYEHVRSILEAENFDHARLKPPEKTDYGALVTYVWDPSGVLIHFAEFLNE